MTPPTHDNALDALERARRAQEKHDRRVDVQLRVELDLGKCDAPRCGLPAEVTDSMGGRFCSGHDYLRRTPEDAGDVDPDHRPTADDELTAIAAELVDQLAQLYPHLEPLARKQAAELAEAAAVIVNHAARQATS